MTTVSIGLVGGFGCLPGSDPFGPFGVHVELQRRGTAAGAFRLLVMSLIASPVNKLLC